MGFRYYTTVTFPVAAMQIEEIAAAVKEFNHGGDRSIEDDGSGSGTVVVSDIDANYGDMDYITSVLCEFDVPYDHHHSESEGSNSMPWTQYVRWANEKEGESVELNEAEEERARFAAGLLAELQAGEFEAVLFKLHEEADRVSLPLPEDWQPDPTIFVRELRGDPMIDATKYPQLAKMQDVKDASQPIGEFIEWLGEQGLTICEFDSRGERYAPSYRSIEQRLADFFEIDLNVVEEERRAILDGIRSGAAA